MDYRNLSQLASLLLGLSTFYFAVISAEHCPADAEKDWSYDSSLPNGPPNWGKKYPNCNRKSQSPVNIITRHTVRSGTPQRLELKGYDKPITKVMIMNNGHMIHVMPKDGVERSVTVDGEEFKLKAFHFHWGNKTRSGSEDVINGRRHTMEVHLIHLNKEGKIVAVGSFLQKSHRLNSALANILSVKGQFKYEGGHFEGEIPPSDSDPHRQGKIYLEDLIYDECPYYRYSGSIGFPPCDEGITWIICRKSKEVCSYQLNELFSLHSVKEGTPDEDKCHLQNIYRPLQPLNGRKIYS